MGASNLGESSQLDAPLKFEGVSKEGGPSKLDGRSMLVPWKLSVYSKLAGPSELFRYLKQVDRFWHGCDGRIGPPKN